MGSAYSGASAVWNPDAPTSRVAYWGAPQTIEVMAKAALEDSDHFETRQLCEIVCRDLDSKDYVSEYLAMYNCLLAHSRYMRDPRRTELVRAPYLIARMIMAGDRPSIDCDDASTFMAASTMALGGQADYVTAAFTDQFFDGKRQYSHVFPRALEPRTRQHVILDTVAAERTPQMLRRIVAYDVWPITS